MRARACLVKVDDQCHDEAKPAAMKRDEKNVQDLIVYITENMTNPFHVDNHLRQLINISTGLHASHDIEDLLLKSVETGRTKMKIFVESSLSTDKAEIVRQLSNEHVIDLPDLFCSHEEADTRILLHVIHSDKIFQQLSKGGRIIVKCSDTDVLVLCVHYFKVLVSTEQMCF
ncbi:Hypothetical predicted protein [Mytilus galloprovincialis]|uniref:Uncharacterized protein n=1 Tax=Mytilus galloprovincialis TaxID=29158 RepID=A0A8B6BMW7_MYTGA|nr:Hypothetical predicted protein [Mytilus galloprovincialis]